jgi:hypothetical protein
MVKRSCFQPCKVNKTGRKKAALKSSSLVSMECWKVAECVPSYRE